MSFIVSNIVGGVIEQNSIMNKCLDNWAAEKVIIASNEIACAFMYLISPSSKHEEDVTISGVKINVVTM